MKRKFHLLKAGTGLSLVYRHPTSVVVTRGINDCIFCGPETWKPMSSGAQQGHKWAILPSPGPPCCCTLTLSGTLCYFCGPNQLVLLRLSRWRWNQSVRQDLRVSSQLWVRCTALSHAPCIVHGRMEALGSCRLLSGSSPTSSFSSR